jgi:hypothetical protein
MYRYDDENAKPNIASEPASEPVLVLSVGRAGSIFYQSREE